MQTPSTALLRLGWVAAIIYLGFGLFFGFLPSHWDEASLTDQILYIVFLVGGGLLLIAGLRLFSTQSRGWSGAGLDRRTGRSCAAVRDLAAPPRGDRADRPERARRTPGPRHRICLTRPRTERSFRATSGTLAGSPFEGP